jgi:hypothetical protein
VLKAARAGRADDRVDVVVERLDSRQHKGRKIADIEHLEGGVRRSRSEHLPAASDPPDIPVTV